MTSGLIFLDAADELGDLDRGSELEPDQGEVGPVKVHEGLPVNLFLQKPPRVLLTAPDGGHELGDSIAAPSDDIFD